jgi:hypothetical protein
MKILLLALIFVANGVYSLQAQTSIDLRTQVKNVDFSNADWTRTSKTGTTLPTLCQIGESFFKSDAAPGQNLYGCSATNIWSLQSGTAGAPGVPGAPGPQGPPGAGSGGAFAVAITRTNATTLTVSLAGVTLKINGIPVTFSQDSTLAVQPSQTGTVRVYVSAGAGGTAAGTVTVANTMATPPVCTGCTVVSGTSYPTPAIEIATWDSANGAWNATATAIPQDSRQATRFIAGSNVTISNGSEGVTVSSLSNVGPAGPTGATGLTGAPGVNGAPGATGPPGSGQGLWPFTYRVHDSPLGWVTSRGSTTSWRYWTLQLVHGSDSTEGFNVALPPTVDATKNLLVHIPYELDANTGVTFWGVTKKCVHAGTVLYYPQTFDAEVTGIGSTPAAINGYGFVDILVPMAGCNGGDNMQVKVTRHGASASDTSTGTAWTTDFLLTIPTT